MHTQRYVFKREEKNNNNLQLQLRVFDESLFRSQRRGPSPTEANVKYVFSDPLHTLARTPPSRGKG